MLLTKLINDLAGYIGIILYIQTFFEIKKINIFIIIHNSQLHARTYTAVCVLLGGGAASSTRKEQELYGQHDIVISPNVPKTQ